VVQATVILATLNAGDLVVFVIKYCQIDVSIAEVITRNVGGVDIDNLLKNKNKSVKSKHCGVKFGSLLDILSGDGNVLDLWHSSSPVLDSFWVLSCAVAPGIGQPLHHTTFPEPTLDRRAPALKCL
jgi:hypothetical protein